MIDSETEMRIIVEDDPEYGLFVRVCDWEDKDQLEDFLCEKHGVDYEYYKAELNPAGKKIAYILYFGSKFEKAYLQRLIDKI